MPWYHNGVVTDYILDGGQVVGEKSGSNYISYEYDAAGKLVAMVYNGTKYYYVTNAMGDVLGLMNTSGDMVVNYRYDPYGQVLSVNGSMASTIGAANPFRYRGYYYDTETGLYYLNSRYYNPEIGRFINADGYVSTGQGILGHNMFAYCNNNPVMYQDPSGHSLIGIILLGVAVIGSAFVFSADNPNTIEMQKEKERQEYEKELIAAREKYTENNVSINGSIPSNAADIKISINPDHIDNGRKDPNIHIKNSWTIDSKAEREVIIDLIIASPEFDKAVFTRGKDKWMAEWTGHNVCYSMLSWSPLGENLAHVDLNENEVIPWEIVW